MKNVFRTLTALTAALLMAVSASAVSPGATPAMFKKAEPIPVVAKGMIPLRVTSSLADFCKDTAPLFDGRTDTSVEVAIDEETVDSAFTLCTAVGIAQPLSAVAVITESGTNAQLNVRISGTNDSSQKEWTPLALSGPVVKTGDWTVLNLSEPENGWKDAERYAFYKIEFSFDAGTSFTFTECLLIRPDLGEPVLTYESVESVPVGQTPPIVPAYPEDAEPVLPRAISRGLLLPGFTK